MMARHPSVFFLILILSVFLLINPVENKKQKVSTDDLRGFKTDDSISQFGSTESQTDDLVDKMDNKYNSRLNANEEPDPGYTLKEMVCDEAGCREKAPSSTSTNSGVVKSRRPSNQIQFKQARKILQGNTGSNLYDVLAAENKPTIIQASDVFNQWAAMKDWSLLYFMDNWKLNHLLYPVFKSNGTEKGTSNALLLFRDQSPEFKWKGVRKPYEEIPMYFGNFINNQCGQETEGPPETSVWFSRIMEALDDDILDEDTMPLDFFIKSKDQKNDEDTTHQDEAPKISKQNLQNSTKPVRILNMSNREAIMQLHYDIDDTWIVQTFRRQQVMLFSPEQMRKLYLYPRVHPHHRRSQVMPMMEATEDDFEGISSIQGLEAMLVQGDVLFIPKFWGYHIRNFDPSIFVQVTSPTQESRDAIDNLRKSFFQVAQLPEETTRFEAVRRALNLIVDQINVGNTQVTKDEDSDNLAEEPATTKRIIKNILAEHIKQRYSKLPNYGVTREERTKFDQRIRKTCQKSRKVELPAALNNAINAKANLAIETLNAIKDKDIKSILLSDWIDFMAYQAVGGQHAHIKSFLSHCF